MGKNMRKRILRAVFSVGIVLFCILASINKANAEEYTVTKSNAVLYSAENAAVYLQPDAATTPVTYLAGNVTVQVTGITSNGWYEIDLNGTYYVQSNGLKAPTIVDGEIFTYSEAEIKELTAGSFAFYTTKELANFKTSDVNAMNDNTYLRYLDSYIMGYGVLNDCIIRDMSLTLYDYVKGKIAANSSYAAKSNREILIDYRNEFLETSMKGPHRTEKSMQLALTKAIRYDKSTFVAEFKNASIGDSQSKIKEIVEDVIKIIKSEQGITFDYSMEYRDEYWYITFTKK